MHACWHGADAVTCMHACMRLQGCAATLARRLLLRSASHAPALSQLHACRAANTAAAPAMHARLCAPPAAQCACVRAVRLTANTSASSESRLSPRPTRALNSSVLSRSCWSDMACMRGSSALMASTLSWYCLRVFSDGSCLNSLSKKACDTTELRGASPLPARRPAAPRRPGAKGAWHAGAVARMPGTAGARAGLRMLQLINVHPERRP